MCRYFISTNAVALCMGQQMYIRALCSFKLQANCAHDYFHIGSDRQNYSFHTLNVFKILFAIYVIVTSTKQKSV